MYRFILTGKNEGKTVLINNRYEFINGLYEVNDDDGEKIKPILVDFFACRLTKINDSTEVEKVPVIPKQVAEKDWDKQ